MFIYLICQFASEHEWSRDFMTAVVSTAFNSHSLPLFPAWNQSVVETSQRIRLNLLHAASWWQNLLQKWVFDWSGGKRNSRAVVV